MADAIRWSARNPDRYQQAYELLMMEQPRDRVVTQLVRAGLSEQDAAKVVDEAWKAGHGDRRKEGRGEIALGLGLIVAGLLATLLFSALLRPTGFYLLFWGALVYGVFSVIRGGMKLFR